MDIAWLVDTFPLIRGGGAFLIVIGFGILVGPFGSRKFQIICMVNALMGLRATRVDYRVFWGIDGLLKILAGAAMIWLSLQ